MSGTNVQSAAVQRGARQPASLVDSQLQHLESVVVFMTREDASSASHALDQEYWEKRVRALEENYELLASQKQRMTKLLDRLTSEARIAPERRAAV